MAGENEKANTDNSGVSLNLNTAIDPVTTPIPSAAVSQKLYSSDDPANNQVDLKKTGFDLNIKQEKTQNSLNPNEENIVDSIVRQATVDKNNEKKILQELETLDPAMAGEDPVAPMVENSTKTAKKIFITILIIALGSVAYFYITQKGLPLLGLQATTKLAEAETKLAGTSEQVVINYLMESGIEYRNLAYFSSVYGNEIQNGRTANVADINEYLSKLKLSLSAAKTFLKSEKSLSESIFIALSDKLRSHEESLKIAKNDFERKSIKLDIELTKEAQKLAKLLIDEINKENEALEGEESKIVTFEKRIDNILKSEYQNRDLLNNLDQIFKTYNFNDYAKVAHIQESRVNWTEVINEIENVTKSIDPNFSFDGTINGDGISYSAFSFNRDNNRVNITGLTRTADVKTFTLIADLTDAFEQSPMFSIHDSRTYSKQADEESGYRASITLDVILETKETL